ncbi:MAG: PQQ-binding-like beta-propeller repeat protein [Spirochaetaceae bacterium]|jgi:outer membrane protein assembly factor BamB|nr:PQQ-binding-like beta-propeller repeat protein [Spirochaetaceae bacterium]
MNLKALVIFVLTFLSSRVFAQPVEGPELLWRQVLGGVALTRPAWQLESVIVVCEGGIVKAFGSSGALLWEYKAGGRLLPFITRSGNGASYICRTDGTFHAINRAGRLLWKVNLKDRLSAPPLIGWDDRIFVFLTGKLCCFTASGTQLWQIQLESPLAARPVPDRAGGFAGALENGKLIRVSAFGKMDVLQLSAAPVAVMTLPPTEGLNGGRLSFIAVHSDGRMELAGDDGGLTEAPKLPAAPIAVKERGGLLAVFLATGNLALISPEQDFGVIWSVKTGFARQDDGVEIDWDERGIYLLSKSGGEGYSPEGARRWNMKLSDSVTTPVLDGNGVMYSCGKDWILYAYRVEDDKRPPDDKEVYSFEAEGIYGLGEAPLNSEFPLWFGFSLNMVEAGIRAGNLGEMEPAYTKLLLGIVDGPGQPGRQNSFESLNLRIKALTLLGLIGSRETIPFLTRVFRQERNLIIKSAAAETIGAIGVDPEGRALDAFAELIVLPGPYLRERLLASIAVSIGNLCRFSGPPLSGRGIPLLVSLTYASQPRSVRSRAERELAAIYRY